MKIREARIDDDAEAARLLGELGYPSTADEVRGRISRAITSKSTGVLLAERNKKVVGLAAFHYISYFAVMGAFCRVTALVVGESERRTGVANALMAAVESAAARSGCDLIEITSGKRSERAAAHHGYEKLGYHDTSAEAARYWKRLDGRA